MLKQRVSLRNLQGFTIVELLIVVVVIGILASITLVAYNGIQVRANRVAVQSDLSNIKKKLELYRLDNGSYPHSTTGTEMDVYNQLRSIDMKVSTGSYATGESTNLYYASKNDGSAFFMLFIPDGSETLYTSSSTSGTGVYSEDYPTCAAGSNTRYPGGSGAQIARCVELASENPVLDATTYYVYTPPQGFRIWN